jgi:hypothetical protein
LRDFEVLVTEGVGHATSRNLVGQNVLMYGYLHLSDRQTGRTAINVSVRSEDLSDGRIAPYFKYPGPLREVALRRDGIAAARFFYRIGRRYLGDKLYAWRTELPRTETDWQIEDIG